MATGDACDAPFRKEYKPTRRGKTVRFALSNRSTQEGRPSSFAPFRFVFAVIPRLFDATRALALIDRGSQRTSTAPPAGKFLRRGSLAFTLYDLR
jgi:hypothetical protein